MTGARRPARRAVTEGHTSRWSASFAVAAAAHAAVLSMLAGSAIVRLEIEPARIELAFLEASDRTAGPGETAPELRMAAPAAAPAAPPPSAEPTREKDPVPAPALPVVRLEPAPVVEPRAKPQPEPKSQPRPKSQPAMQPESPPAAAQPDSPPAAATQGATGQGTNTASATAGTTPGGTDARPAAPAWAPSARVRYEQLLFAWMERHKQYPLLAQRRGIEGEGSVRVRIDRSGRVLERTVTRSTGEKILDQAALDMVRRANPLPAVPPAYGGDTFEFNFPIRYRLH
jgi:protein TonB